MPGWHTQPKIHDGPRAPRSVGFKISHMGLAYVLGRFNTFSGSFSLDPDASKSSFEMKIQAKTIDTNNTRRDTHLRGPDFFNVVQFPVISFKSTSVKPIQDGLAVTGDFTMHGVTKPITLELKGGKIAQIAPGKEGTGFTTDLVLKRSEFGVGLEKFKAGLGDEVYVTVSFEGMKK